MASSDSIMMDSPAQTPDPKGQFSAPPGPPPGEASTDVLMTGDSHGNESTEWDTKKWREDVQIVNNRLQHAHWNPSSKYRDPMSKPLVTQPKDLTPEMDSQIREYFRQRKDQLQGRS